jgi:3-oxoacyl-[acyl-carrier protein] reductase
MYAASKAALEMLTKALALDAAEAGIRVNAVAPMRRICGNLIGMI